MKEFKWFMIGAAIASAICYRVYPERIVVKVFSNLECEDGPTLGKVSCYVAEVR